MSIGQDASHDLSHVTISVAGTVARRSHVSAYLLERRIAHYTHFQENTPLPEGWESEWPLDWLNWGHTTGAWRCYLSHKAALKAIPDGNVGFIFEDDAHPHDGWVEVMQSAMSLLSDFEVVSLHGRLVRKNAARRFMHDGRQWLIPGHSERRRGLQYRLCCGSLAYLIRQDSIHKYMHSAYDGFPVDLLLANRYSFCVIADSPIDHPREGSVLNAT